MHQRSVSGAASGFRPRTFKRESRVGHLDGLRVLLVDDERDSRAFLSAVLSSAGALVFAFESGEATLQALSALGQPLFDLAVIDIRLPGMPGYELLQRIRDSGKLRERVPTIAVTDYDSQSVRAQVKAVAFDAYVLKPIDRSAFVQTATRLTEGRRSDS